MIGSDIVNISKIEFGSALLMYNINLYLFYKGELHGAKALFAHSHIFSGRPGSTTPLRCASSPCQLQQIPLTDG